MIRDLLQKAFSARELEHIEKHVEQLLRAPKLIGDVDLRFDGLNRPTGIVITIRLPRMVGGLADLLRRKP